MTVRANRWEVNKAARREAILRAARAIILEGDVGDLTMRKLAACADVSVRTIYNLIGNQNDVLAAIVREMVDVMRGSIAKVSRSAPIERVEALATEPLRLILGNPGLFKPALRVVEGTQAYNIHQFAEPQGIALLVAEMRSAVDKGLLLPDAPVEALAQLMFQAAARACADWCKEIIDDGEYWRRVLTAQYVTLASVATEPTRSDLLRRLKALLASREPEIAAAS